MSRFFDPRYSSIRPYVPGEQPRDAEYIKLNTNESPFPPSPRIKEALARLGEPDRCNLYPDPTCRELKTAIAGYYGVGIDNVFVADGSDSVLSFAFAAFGGDGIAYPDVTYGFYPCVAAYDLVDSLIVPVRDDLSVDPDSLSGLGRAVVLAEPNAPTGLSLGLDAIERIAASDPDHVLIVDEAYIDFGAATSVPLTKKYKNVLVVQTFSKSRSLAGARVGFAIGDAELISDLETLKFSTDPYDVSRISSAAACEAMRDVAYFERNRAAVIATRERVRAALERRGAYCTDSKANFLFVRFPGKTGRELYEGLRARGVLVRYFDAPKTRDFIRVTVGADADMDALLAAFDEITSEA